MIHRHGDAFLKLASPVVFFTRLDNQAGSGTQMEKVPFTREGLEKLKQELKDLVKVERPNNIKAIEEARAHGDLSENAEYHAAKERQGFIEGRMNELQSVIGRAEVIEPDGSTGGGAFFGRKIVLLNLQTDKEVSYRLVGPYESDPEKGQISVTSPLGRAMLGKEEGDEFTAKTPAGVLSYEIIEIS